MTRHEIRGSDSAGGNQPVAGKRVWQTPHVILSEVPRTELGAPHAPSEPTPAFQLTSNSIVS
jgi:hypothetical protein